MFARSGLTPAEASHAEEYFYIANELIERPGAIILRFNPWWFSGQENITRAFFLELANALPESENHAARDAARTLASRYSVAGGAAVALVAALGGFPVLGPAISSLAGAIGAWGQKTDSLTTLKATLAKALSYRKNKVVVIIDDVDRLLPFEAVQILSLVKSLGDLPNVLYLLAYDQKIIQRILNNSAATLQPDFLEKIIQYEAPVPLREPDALSALLRVFPEIPPDEQRSFSNRFGSTYYQAIRPYIRQPREVARLANALEAALPSLAGHVDPIDFLVLETLRLNENIAYQTIREHLDWLTGGSSFSEASKISDEILTALKECNRPDDAKVAIAHLFPRLSELWRTISSGHKDRAGDAADRRICVSLYARSYFTLVPAPHIISTVDLDNLFAEANPLPLLQDLIDKAKASSGAATPTRLPVLIEQIGDRMHSAKVDASALAKAIFDTSEEIIAADDADPQMFGGDNSRRLEYVIERWIAKLDEANRLQILSPIATTTSGLSLLSNVARSLAPDKNSEGASRTSRLLPEPAVIEIRNIVLNKIREAAQSGNFWGYADPAGILWSWWGMTDGDEVRAWLAQQVQQQEKALELMSAMPSLVRSTAGNYFSVQKVSWKHLVDVDNLVTKAEAFATDQSLPDVKRKIASDFIAAVQRDKR